MDIICNVMFQRCTVLYCAKHFLENDYNHSSICSSLTKVFVTISPFSRRKEILHEVVSWKQIAVSYRTGTATREDT